MLISILRMKNISLQIIRPISGKINDYKKNHSPNKKSFFLHISELLADPSSASTKGQKLYFKNIIIKHIFISTIKNLITL